MASDWQRWYQHEIDKWQGSATIQTFSDLAYRGFHNLIMAQFQSEDGKLPSDLGQLAKLSRLGVRWQKVAAEVMGEFEDDGQGRIFNPTQFKIWQAARDRHIAYLNRKKKPNQKHDPDPIDDLSMDDPPPIDNPSIELSHGIDDTKKKKTEKEKKDKNKSAEQSSAPVVPVDPVVFLLLTSGEEHPVDRSLLPGWAEAYPGVDVQRELYLMREWLAANPRRRKTARGINAFIVSWLTRVQDSGKTSNVSNPASVGMFHAPTAELDVPLSLGEVMGPEWCKKTLALYAQGEPLSDPQKQYIRELERPKTAESEAA